MAYASGKHAYGISDQSGRRYRLRDMKTEWTAKVILMSLSQSIHSCSHRKRFQTHKHVVPDRNRVTRATIYPIWL